jgi:DNA mismatch endonuclease (patch repair protein)
MDNLTKNERSSLMRKVKSKKNKSTELKTIEIFKSLGIKGWQRGYKIIGHPDFVFRKQRIAIFVDGCFWHGCARHCRIPMDNHEYWINKVKKNIARDIKITEYIQQKNWNVLRIWEHELEKKSFNDAFFEYIKSMSTN